MGKKGVTVSVKSGITAQERRARFSHRASVLRPDSLPAPWQVLLNSLDHKLLSAQLHRSTYQSDWRGGMGLKLNFRLFGLDKDVDNHLMAGLEKLALQGLKKPLGDQRVDGDLKGWQIEIDRMVAPAGIARQTDVVLSWYRRPKPTEKRGRCHKPHPVKVDGRIPAWLRRVLSKRSTRRCIYSQVNSGSLGVTGRMQMLYHNGFAHDENVGQLVTAAKKAGMAKRSGEGPNQRFTDTNGQSLELATVRRPHDMGCEPKGPILEIEWQGIEK
jgi:hypothetical protein